MFGKPMRFKFIKETTEVYLTFMEKSVNASILKTLGRIAASPFDGLAYVLALPFAFLVAWHSGMIRGRTKYNDHSS